MLFSGCPYCSIFLSRHVSPLFVVSNGLDGSRRVTFIHSKEVGLAEGQGSYGRWRSFEYPAYFQIAPQSFVAASCPFFACRGSCSGRGFGNRALWDTLETLLGWWCSWYPLMKEIQSAHLPEYSLVGVPTTLTMIDSPGPTFSRESPPRSSPGTCVSCRWPSRMLVGWLLHYWNLLRLQSAWKTCRHSFHRRTCLKITASLCTNLRCS